jgi:chitin synthase
MVGGLYYAWEVSQMTSTVLLILVTVGFTVVCIYCAPDTQLMVAKVLTIFSAMIMAAVVVGTIVQIVDESTPHVLPETSTFLPIPTTTRNSSITTPSTHQEIVWNSLPSSTPPSPTTTIPSHVHLPISITNMYLAFLTGMFIVTAIMHLPEAFCLFHGIWYLLCLPAGNLIMMIYSICNLTDRSWGTREEKQSNFSTSGSQLDVIVEFLKKIFFCCDKSSTTVAAAVTESRTSDDSQVDLAGDDIDQVDGPTNNRSQQHPTRRTSGSFSKHRTDDSSRFQFANINAFSQPIPVSDWLPQNLRDQYGSTLEMNGYDDTSYLFGMTDSELRDVGITSKAHRSAIHEAIKFLPEPEIEPCVPKNVTHWLENVGLSMYATNFCKAHIVNATTMETLKGMKRKDLKSELGITKPGHQKRLLLAISKLRHATTMERAQMETKHEIDALKTHNLKTVRPEEYDFWECLRQQRLLPESTVFAHDLELKEKLIELRNSTLLVFAITNVIWLILISTLVTKAQLNVLDTNALGLAFLIVFGLILCIQFICMLLHRCSTWMHLIARTPTKCGDPVRASWAFRDLTTADQLNLMANADLTNNTEDAEARRARDEINDQLRRAYQDRVTQRLISVDASLSEGISERQPLLGSQGRTSSAGYSSLGRPVGNTSSTVSAHQRTVHFNAECV